MGSIPIVASLTAERRPVLFPPGVLRLLRLTLMTTAAIPQIDKLIPLSEAAQRLDMSASRLRSLIQRGDIKAAILPNGELVVNEQTVTDLAPKDQRPEYKKHVHLKGRPISLSDACRKYKVSVPTLSRWVKRGYIEQLGKEGSRVMVDEADIAYCSEIYGLRGGQGRWLFNSNGTPYSLKNV
jgi:hypothetical protein